MKINITMEMTPQEAKEMLNVPDMKKILEERIQEEIQKVFPTTPKMPNMIGPGLIEENPLWKDWKKHLYTTNPWMTGPTAKED